MRLQHDTDVVVIGAGPYGLSVAAHAAASGLRYHVFGRTLSFWEESIPPGFVVGTGLDTEISSPQPGLTLRQFSESVPSQNQSLRITREVFLQYAKAFVVSNNLQPDSRLVSQLSPSQDSLLIQLDDGTSLTSGAVVVATGPLQHRFVPDEIRSLPPDLWSHSSSPFLLERLTNKKVLVVGGGLSALESGVLLTEAGSDVHVLSRRDRSTAPIPYYGTQVRDWIARSTSNPLWWAQLTPAERAQITTMIQDYNPIQDWLATRLDRLRLHISKRISSITASSDLHVVLDSGEDLHVDHIVAATGFRPALRNLSFLSPFFNGAMGENHAGPPAVDASGQWSVPGVYFSGFIVSEAFGPALRLVAGTANHSASVVDSIVRALHAPQKQPRLHGD